MQSSAAASIPSCSIRKRSCARSSRSSTFAERPGRPLRLRFLAQFVERNRQRTVRSCQPIQGSCQPVSKIDRFLRRKLTAEQPRIVRELRPQFREHSGRLRNWLRVVTEGKSDCGSEIAKDRVLAGSADSFLQLVEKSLRFVEAALLEIKHAQ